MDESHWHQILRLNHIKYEDHNTHFFHATTLYRKKRNVILIIKYDNVKWINDEDGAIDFIAGKFKAMFKKDHYSNIDEVLQAVDSFITPDMNIELMKDISNEEIDSAFF
ncbi:hypothetical protein REPUB_Repub03eG0263100 [Reevesia pubescens]